MSKFAKFLNKVWIKLLLSLVLYKMPWHHLEEIETPTELAVRVVEYLMILFRELLPASGKILLTADSTSLMEVSRIPPPQARTRWTERRLALLPSKDWIHSEGRYAKLNLSDVDPRNDQRTWTLTVDWLVLLFCLQLLFPCQVKLFTVISARLLGKTRQQVWIARWKVIPKT